MRTLLVLPRVLNRALEARFAGEVRRVIGHPTEGPIERRPMSAVAGDWLRMRR
jgi:hypothetical protein